jgi:hypothetical protein
MKYAKQTALAFVLSLGIFAGQIAPVAIPVGLGAIVITQTACPSSQSIAQIAGEVYKYSNAAIVIFESNGQSTTRLIQVRDMAGKVRDAFNAGDNTSAVDYARQLIMLFNLLTDDAKAIQNPTTRTIILVALFIVNEKLTDLANKVAAVPETVKVAASRRNSSAVNTIEAFRAKKNWRCRSSQTGQFAKMEYCKAHPDVSVIEIY